MREIKFRAWDDHYKYMNYKVLVGTYGEWEKVKDDKNYTACSMWIEPDKVDYECEPHWAHFEPYHKDIHLMQYTGLKDKNGVEIYEGDIIDISYDEAIIKNAVIEYHGASFYACTNSDMWELDNYFDIEAVGNIYEDLKESGE